MKRSFHHGNLKEFQLLYTPSKERPDIDPQQSMNSQKSIAKLGDSSRFDTLCQFNNKLFSKTMESYFNYNINKNLYKEGGYQGVGHKAKIERKFTNRRSLQQNYESKNPHIFYLQSLQIEKHFQEKNLQSNPKILPRKQFGTKYKSKSIKGLVSKKVGRLSTLNSVYDPKFTKERKHLFK